MAAVFSAQRLGTPILILTIKECWIKKIWSGEKREEYRNITPYYDKRFEKYKNTQSFTVGFRAGYSMNSLFISCLCKLHIGKGKENWGAEKDKEYYVLEILKVNK